MAKIYRRHLGTRLINWWFRTLTKLGLGASCERWLVAGYGPANWVLNALVPAR